ncbi:MAG: acyclic terpene utilization AtuA family protein [Anaerorhabdus sp.]
MKKIRIGSGAGFGGDRIEPAIDLIKRGNLDYIIFECLAERTISLAQKEKTRNPAKGYNELFEYRMDKVLDALKEEKVTVITNMGAANPKAAALVCKEMAQQKGFKKMKIAYVLGDDISKSVNNYLSCEVIETKQKLKEIKDEIISANGYVGVRGIVDALKNNADIIITGRVADPSLVLAPLIYEFDWAMDEYDKLGRGTLIGHLLECAGQVTGGYFANPPFCNVPDLWNLGFPFIDVDENGDGLISKLDNTGGLVSEETVKQQILYEIQDPSTYFTPDVIADFSKVEVEQVEMNKVAVKNASGRAPNGHFKTSVGYRDCYIGEGQISYGGENALERARIAEGIIRKRLEVVDVKYSEINFEYIGYSSLFKKPLKEDTQPNEVRLRAAARTEDVKNAKIIGNEVEALYTNGPYGGGGVRKEVVEVIGICSILIPAENFDISVGYEEVCNNEA